MDGLPEGQKVDARRRRWIAWDVDFLHEPLGRALLERFGRDGVTVFQAFLSECKRSPREGCFTYYGEADGLQRLGVGCSQPKDDAGQIWTLQDLWRWLRRRGQVKSKSSRTQVVVCSESWDAWQKRRPEHTNRRPLEAHT